ncbi:HBL182Wp [Eremothecium sinecaudum]|uniref:HBL182Wp n=1 Tax=Eremothecium sinecaudum TaxID=45286 RepID=A0A120K0V4_9SACH|nr:HBL182Wp [Eremothecium sinecaudum]AMD18720.1 HBL182Wp [Eremothecium sinecaudum]
MFICLPLFIGKREWVKPYAGNEAGRYNELYCPSCRSYSVYPVKKREFVTVLFVPIIPLYWGNQLCCRVCRWNQDFDSQQQLDKVLMEQKNIREGAAAAGG